MINPNEHEAALRSMAITGAAIVVALLVGVFLIGWGLT
jgi:hypothetical protein